MKLILKLNSVTYAMKASSLLKNKNIKSEILKNPRPKKGEGCGYILKINGASGETLEYLKENGVEIKEAVWE